MLIIGLTGSIGMGKSTAAQHFVRRGIAVFDADAAVHELYRGAAVGPIEAAFPGVTSDGVVDRQKLGAVLIEDPTRFSRLEAIVHPMVREAERRFLREQAEAGADLVVLEIPLLFETGANALVDVVIIVTADAETQAARVLQRPGMTTEKLAQIMGRQMPDLEKRQRADFIVDTNGPVEGTQAALDAIILKLRGEQRQAHDKQAYERHWSKIR